MVEVEGLALEEKINDLAIIGELRRGLHGAGREGGEAGRRPSKIWETRWRSACRVASRAATSSWACLRSRIMRWAAGSPRGCTSGSSSASLAPATTWQSQPVTAWIPTVHWQQAHVTAWTPAAR